jgi:hypothetical protein
MAKKELQKTSEKQQSFRKEPIKKRLDDEFNRPALFLWSSSRLSRIVT